MMNVYRNRKFRIMLGVALCFLFIKVALYIGRTYWGTMMFLTGTYLFFSILFLVLLMVELKRLEFSTKNITMKTLKNSH